MSGFLWRDTINLKHSLLSFAALYVHLLASTLAQLSIHPQCSLLAGAEDARALARLAIPMTETDFLNLCEERALAGKCGNPLCTNPHAYKAPSHTPKIDWATLAMVTVTIEQHWCSNECHAKCAQFAKSLGNAIDRLQVLNRLQEPTCAPLVPCQSLHAALQHLISLLTTSKTRNKLFCALQLRLTKCHQSYHTSRVGRSQGLRISRHPSSPMSMSASRPLHPAPRVPQHTRPPLLLKRVQAPPHTHPTHA